MNDIIELATSMYARSIIGLSTTDKFGERVRIIVIFFKSFHKYYVNAQYGRNLGFDYSVEPLANLEHLFLDMVVSSHNEEYLVAKLMNERVK